MFLRKNRKLDCCKSFQELVPFSVDSDFWLKPQMKNENENENKLSSYIRIDFFQILQFKDFQ